MTLALILVDVQSVTYLKVDQPQPVAPLDVAKGMVTGTPPKIGGAAGVEWRGDRPG